MRDVDEPRARRIGRWLPVLGAGSTGADVAHDSARALPLLACVVQRAGLAIDAGRRRDVDERRGRDHFAGRAIDHVDVPVAIGVHEDLAWTARQREIDQEAFIRGVVIEFVVWTQLVEPARMPRRGIAREEARGELVVARSLLRVPGRWIAGAVVDEVELGVVRNPTRDAAAADLPGVARPGGDAEVDAFLLRVERLIGVADQDVLVGPGAVGAPELLAARRVERGQPTTHAEFATAVADQHPAFDDERRHGACLARADIACAIAPQLLAAVGGECDRLVVERVEEDLAVRVDHAAVDDIEQGNALRERLGLRLELPLERCARTCEVERVDDVRIWRDDVHQARSNDRCRLMAAQDAGRKRERELETADIRACDLGQWRITRARVIASGHRPVAVRRRLRSARCHGDHRKQE